MTPEQEAQVRRALAALGHENPEGSPGMPPEVAARMDHVLAELAASRAEPDELAARRRRRWPHVLVAAAVAVIAVTGVTVLLRDVTPPNGDEGSASSAARAPAAASAPSAGRSSPGASSSSPARSFAEGALAVPELHSKTIDRDVRRVAKAPSAAAPRQPLRAQAPRSPAVGGCAVPGARPGDQLVAVRLDGRRAVLLLSTAHDGSRKARVYVCADSAHAVATTTVPAG